MTKSVEIDNEIYIGEDNFTIIAGPCAIESREQMISIAEFLIGLDIKILRGGAFKPRTSPESFQGLGFKGFEILKGIKEDYGLKIISEVIDPRDVEEAIEYIDIIQIGARNMQNFALLKEVGKTKKPIMLKRGMSATIKEWIYAAEYIRSEGNENIILCERGIRTFENYTRNTLDLLSVPIIQKETGYPIFVDPSHGTGIRDLILPASKAAKALGSNGIMVEVHPNPDEALSDGAQSLDFEQFEELYNNLLAK